MNTNSCDAGVNTDISISCNAIVTTEQIKQCKGAIERVDYKTYSNKHKFIVPTILYGNTEIIKFKHNIKDLGNVILEFPNLKQIIFSEGVHVNITSTFVCPATLEKFDTFGNIIESLDLVKFNTDLKILSLFELCISSVAFIGKLTKLKKLELIDNEYLIDIDVTLPTSLNVLTIDNCPIENINTMILPRSLDTLELTDFEIKNKFPTIVNTLVQLNISRTNTTSLDFLPIMPNLTTFIFNEYKTCTNRRERIANQIDILDLAKFPALNELIASCAGIKKIINYECNVFSYLDISSNKISDFTGWKFERNTKFLNISTNLITSINNNQWPSFITDMFCIAKNPITYLPLALIYINTQHGFFYDSCPIENLNDPIIRRWLYNHSTKTATIYNNSQNVHDASIVESIKQSIINLAKLPKVITASIHSDVLNNETVHSEYALTECEIALLVENCIATKESSIQQELHAILRDAIVEGSGYCLTGRIDDNVVIKIANSEQIANVILAHHRRNAPHEELIAALKELQMTDEEIGTWLGSCAPQNP